MCENNKKAYKDGVYVYLKYKHTGNEDNILKWSVFQICLNFPQKKPVSMKSKTLNVFIILNCLSLNN
jgi:hypothetical protein